MRHITLAVKAAVISSVLSVASIASAETVDSLSKPPFFPPANETAVTSDNSVSATVLESAADLFAGTSATADPYAHGIAVQRAHISSVFANSKPAPFGAHATAVERGYMSAAAASASVAPAASVATGITVPLPASGLMLCLGLFGLARYARRPS